MGQDNKMHLEVVRADYLIVRPSVDTNLVLFTWLQDLV